MRDAKAVVFVYSVTHHVSEFCIVVVRCAPQRCDPVVYSYAWTQSYVLEYWCVNNDDYVVTCILYNLNTLEDFLLQPGLWYLCAFMLCVGGCNVSVLGLQLTTDN